MSDVFGLAKVVEKIADPVTGLLQKVAELAAEEIGLAMKDAVHVLSCAAGVSSRGEVRRVQFFPLPDPQQPVNSMFKDLGAAVQLIGACDTRMSCDETSAIIVEFVARSA